MAKGKLTEKQAKVVEALLDGSSPTAAVKAGYPTTSNPLLLRAPDVVAALAVARGELSSAAQIKRADVLEMLVQAYDTAHMTAEAGNMVAAAREIGKMLGFYEPETIKVEMTMQQAKLKSKFEIMSDEELLEIAEGRARVVDGDYVRLS